MEGGESGWWSVEGGGVHKKLFSVSKIGSQTVIMFNNSSATETRMKESSINAAQ